MSAHVFRNMDFLADLVRGQAVRSVCFFSGGFAESREYVWRGEFVEEVFIKHKPGNVVAEELPDKYVEVGLCSSTGG